MKKLVAVLLFLILVSALMSCGMRRYVPMFTGDADFTVTLRREDGEGTLIMDVTRRGDAVEACITSPSELAGVKFSRSSGTSVLTTDSVSVPLTEEASRGANVVFDVLSEPIPGSAKSEKKNDGIVYTFDTDGAKVSLRVGPEGLPQSAVIDFEGMKRTVEINGFTKE